MDTTQDKVQREYVHGIRNAEPDYQYIPGEREGANNNLGYAPPEYIPNFTIEQLVRSSFMVAEPQAPEGWHKVLHAVGEQILYELGNRSREIDRLQRQAREQRKANDAQAHELRHTQARLRQYEVATGHTMSIFGVDYLSSVSDLPTAIARVLTEDVKDTENAEALVQRASDHLEQQAIF
jgi:hypothetical protein